eukprot:6491449-Amphidinium_carterae.2
MAPKASESIAGAAAVSKATVQTPVAAAKSTASQPSVDHTPAPAAVLTVPQNAAPLTAAAKSAGSAADAASPKAQTAKRRRFVTSSPAGAASTNYTPLDAVMADNKSINVDARVSFVALTKQTQNGQPCRRLELTQGTTTKSLTVIGEQNVAALASVDFHTRLQLRGVRCNAYRDQTTLVVYANDQLRATVSVVPDENTAWWSFDSLPTVALANINTDEAGQINIVGAVQEVASDHTSITLREETGATVSIALGDAAQAYEFKPSTWYCLHRVKVSNGGKLTLWPSAGVEMLEDE